MTRRHRFFILVLLSYLAGIGLLLNNVLSDLDPRYREAAEDSLVESAQLMASLVEQDVQSGVINTAKVDAMFRAVYVRPFEAKIFSFTKNRVELRLVVTDVAGRVLYDSLGQATGADYSQWRDIHLALRGQYGARTTPDVPGNQATAVMYVAAPVYHAGAVVGAVSVGKPTQSFGQFVQAAREKTIYVGLVSVGAVLLLGFIVSLWLVLPAGLLTEYMQHLRTERRLGLGRLGQRVRGALHAAYAELRDALAGRNYVADYVQTLTHEVKSPLSAIRGAAELLQEAGMPEPERARFLANITREAGRIQEIVDRMMELTALEARRTLDKAEAVPLLPLLQAQVAAAQDAAASRGIALELHTDSEDSPAAQVLGDPFLLRRAVSNLLDNAVDFSPAGGVVRIELIATARQVRIHIQDQGPGIPAYAQAKVFEKFYSLARPHTQKKSTGLGLSFVKEIASLHRGRIELVNNASGPGAKASLSLPRWLG